MELGITPETAFHAVARAGSAGDVSACRRYRAAGRPSSDPHPATRAIAAAIGRPYSRQRHQTSTGGIAARGRHPCPGVTTSCIRKRLSTTSWRRLPTGRNRPCNRLRDVVLGHGVLIPMLAADTSKPEATTIRSSLGQIAGTVRAARLSDLAHLPNNVIIPESARAAGLFAAGHIGHPSREPYLLFHTREGGSRSTFRSLLPG
jgi:hypothetical protein